MKIEIVVTSIILFLFVFGGVFSYLAWRSKRKTTGNGTGNNNPPTPPLTSEEKEVRAVKAKKSRRTFILWSLGVIIVVGTLLCCWFIPELHEATQGIWGFLQKYWIGALAIPFAIAGVIALLLDAKAPDGKIVWSTWAVTMVILLIVTQLWRSVDKTYIKNRVRDGILGSPLTTELKNFLMDSGGFVYHYSWIFIVILVLLTLLVLFTRKWLWSFIARAIVLGLIIVVLFSVIIPVAKAVCKKLDSASSSVSVTPTMESHGKPPVDHIEVSEDEVNFIKWPEDTYWNYRTADVPRPVLVYINDTNPPRADATFDEVLDNEGTEGFPRNRRPMWVKIHPQDKSRLNIITVRYSHRE